jgi:uncharacterized protein (TIGR02001 family)
MNRLRLVNLAALASAVALAGAANAQSTPAPAPAAAAPAPADPLSFNIGVVSDYRYRAISQSRLKPALQGGADYAFASGAYVGTWASTISWIKDAGKLVTPNVDTGSTPLEIDIYGGYKGEIAKDVTYDVGGLYYLYAGNKYDKLGAGASKADTFEIYGAITYGIFTAKYSYSLTTLFGFGGNGKPKSTGSGYLDLSANYDAGDGWTITPHVGHQQVAKYKDFSYTDYGLTVAKDMGKGVSLSGALIQADVKKIGGTAVYASPAGKNLGKGTVVLGAKYTF